MHISGAKCTDPNPVYVRAVPCCYCKFSGSGSTPEFFNSENNDDIWSTARQSGEGLLAISFFLSIESGGLHTNHVGGGGVGLNSCSKATRKNRK